MLFMGYFLLFASGINPLLLEHSMSTVKYLTFDTLNIKKSLISDILNAKIFGMRKQYNLKFGSVWTGFVKIL